MQIDWDTDAVMLAALAELWRRLGTFKLTRIGRARSQPAGIGADVTIVPTLGAPVWVCHGYTEWRLEEEAPDTISHAVVEKDTDGWYRWEAEGREGCVPTQELAQLCCIMAVLKNTAGRKARRIRNA